MDESWLNKNMVPTRCWSDSTRQCEPDVPPGKGERWIMTVAEGKQWWIRERFKTLERKCTV